MKIRKLVRSNIPKIIEKEGKYVKVLPFNQYRTRPTLLLDKVDEELQEVRDAYTSGNMEEVINEIADLEDAIDALKEELDISSHLLIRAKGKKMREKGSLKKSVYIEFETDDLE